MSKKLNAASIKPLSGIRVLVGRARHQSGALSSEFRKRGAEVIAIPFIEIRKPKSFKPLDTALKNLASYDWLILTSVNGVEALWDRMKRLNLDVEKVRKAKELTVGKVGEGHSFTRAARSAKSIAALATKSNRLRIAAIGPATQNAIEQRGVQVDVVPKEYVAESVVKSLKNKVKGKRVLLVRAKVARDVIPRDLRRVGAQVDVVEAYETVVPRSSRARLRAVLKSPAKRPHVVTFTSSSTVRNFVELLGPVYRSKGGSKGRHKAIADIQTASIGPVTSATLRELGLPVDIAAKEFTISGLIEAICNYNLVRIITYK
jgi:uroporphyrinogen-III synthase